MFPRKRHRLSVRSVNPHTQHWPPTLKDSHSWKLDVRFVRLVMRLKLVSSLFVA